MAILSREQWERLFCGYRRIFWGIILTLLHIKLGSIQLLPDFMGYILFISGISSLRRGSYLRGLRRAYFAAAVMVILSVGEFFLSLAGFDAVLPAPLTDSAPVLISLVFLIVMSVLTLLMFYDILSFSADTLRLFGSSSLAEDTYRRLRIFVVVDVIILILNVLFTFSDQSALVLSLAVCMILFRIWLAAVFAKLKRLYDSSQFQDGAKT